MEFKDMLGGEWPDLIKIPVEAVLTGVVIPLGIWIAKRFNDPHIQLEVSDKAPSTVLSEVPGQTPTYWYRVCVANKGRTKAEGTTAFISHFSDETRRTEYLNGQLVQLFASSTDAPDNKSLNIWAGTSRCFDLIYVVNGTREIRYKNDALRERIGKDRLGPGTYKATILVGADNANHKEITVVFDLDSAGNGALRSAKTS